MNGNVAVNQTTWEWDSDAGDKRVMGERQGDLVEEEEKEKVSGGGEGYRKLALAYFFLLFFYHLARHVQSYTSLI